MRNPIVACFALALVGAFGCERKSDSGSKSATNPPAPAGKNDDHAHKPGDKHVDEHTAADGHDHKDGGHGGEVVELGTGTFGEFSLRAARDKVEFKPGGEAPIDVWVDGGVGKGVTAVRFWIGTPDAKGSVKAKAAIEDGKWHAHVEIPSPIPAGSKLWVEIEDAAGKKTAGSFDLAL